MCAKSSTSRITSGVSGEFLHELEEKMEVARLQLQISKALAKSHMLPAAEALEAQERLNADLLDITALYEQFADRYNLYECKLAIIHCAGLYDSALVENLWENIIDKEMSSVNFASQGSINTVSERIANIARAYVNTERYFPVAFVVRHLEQQSCERGCEPFDWVVRTMLEIKIPPQKLVEIYDRMFKSRDPFWQMVRKPLHLLSVIHSLLSNIVTNPSIIPSSERRRFATMVLDAVPSYLVELQAMSSTDSQVATLMAKYRGLQARLERF